MFFEIQPSNGERLVRSPNRWIWRPDHDSPHEFLWSDDRRTSDTTYRTNWKSNILYPNNTSWNVVLLQKTLDSTIPVFWDFVWIVHDFYRFYDALDYHEDNDFELLERIPNHRVYFVELRCSVMQKYCLICKNQALVPSTSATMPWGYKTFWKCEGPEKHPYRIDYDKKSNMLAFTPMSNNGHGEV